MAALLLGVGAPRGAHAQLGVRSDTTHFASLADAVAFSAAEALGLAVAPDAQPRGRPRGRVRLGARDMPEDIMAAVRRRVRPVLDDSIRADSLGSFTLRFTGMQTRGDTVRVGLFHSYTPGCAPPSPARPRPYQTPFGSSGSEEYRYIFVHESAGWRYAQRRYVGVSDGTMLCAAVEPAAPDSQHRDRSPHRTGVVQRDGVRLRYLAWGDTGTTVVLLPGYSLTAHAFDELGPLLAAKHRVVALTPRGFGDSDAPADGEYTINTLVADVHALMDSLHIARAALVAHSLS
jgi:hypothetical protein